MSTEDHDRSEHDKELLHLQARGERYISEGKTIDMEAVLLERFPESGRRIPEYPELPYRELLVLPYCFFHRIYGPKEIEGGTTEEWCSTCWSKRRR